jgi:hypothetical protein
MFYYSTVEERILQRLEHLDDKWEFISKVLGGKEDSRINTATKNGLVPGKCFHFSLVSMCTYNGKRYF